MHYFKLIKSQLEQSFVSVIANVGTWFPAVPVTIKQFADQVGIRLILQKIYITHNKKQIPLLDLLINCISAGSTPQILSIKDVCTFFS